MAVYHRKKDTYASADDEEDDAIAFGLSAYRDLTVSSVTTVEAITVVSIVRSFAILTHLRPAYPPRLHYHYFVVAERWRWLRLAWLPVTVLFIATTVVQHLHDQCFQHQGELCCCFSQDREVVEV